MENEKSQGICSENPRTMYIDLSEKDSAILSELEIGQEVTLTVKGKVCGLSQRERDYGDGVTKHASLDIKSPKIALAKSNAFADMADDEED